MDSIEKQLLRQRRPESAHEAPDDVEKESRWWEGFMAQQKARSTFLEKKMAPSTTETIIEGKNDPEKYENFTIAKEEFTQEDVVWICFPGIGGIAQSHDRRTGSVSGLPTGMPGKMDVIPRQGTAFVFHGPTAIAGYTPEQCIDATERVQAAAEHIVQTFPDKKIRIFGFSAGTHLAVYAAAELARKKGEAVDKLILLSPGESIADGIYKTPVTEPLAKDLYQRGITMEEYNRKIEKYTQRANIRWLPAGRNLVIHAGTKDTFIPTEAEGGTDDLVSLMEEAGKHPTYIKYRGVDHITLPLTMILQQNAGMDPYRLKEPRSAWEDKDALSDTELTGRVSKEVLAQFSDDELRVMGHILSEKNIHKGRNDLDFLAGLKPYEKAIAAGLADRHIGEYGQYTNRKHGYVMRFRVIGEDTIQASSGLNMHEQTIAGFRNIEKAEALLREMDKNEHLATFEKNPLEQSVNIFEEVKKLNLPWDQYAVLIPSALDIRKDKGKIGLMVTPDLYEQLKNSGWQEKMGLHVRTIENGYFRAHIDLPSFEYDAGQTPPGTMFGTWQDKTEVIDGIPILDFQKSRSLQYSRNSSNQIQQPATPNQAVEDKERRERSYTEVEQLLERTKHYELSNDDNITVAAVKHGTDAETAAVAKELFEFFGRHFIPEENIDLDQQEDAIRNSLTDVYTARDQEGKLISVLETSTLDFKDAANSPSGVGLAMWYLATDPEYKGKPLTPKLYQMAYQKALDRARENNVPFQFVVGETEPEIELLMNRFGVKRLYYERPDGAITEVPYESPSATAVGEAVPEHLMIRFFDGTEKVPVERLIEIVTRLQREGEVLNESKSEESLIALGEKFREQLEGIRETFPLSQIERVKLIKQGRSVVEWGPAVNPLVERGTVFPETPAGEAVK